MSAFLIVTTVPVALALAAVLVLRRPLFVMLVELCGNSDRARFWSMFIGVILVLSALSGVLLLQPGTDSAVSKGWPELAGLWATFRAGILSLLAALLAVGTALWRSIQDFEEQRRRSEGWSSLAPPPPASGTS